jgi:purine nucleosidase
MMPLDVTHKVLTTRVTGRASAGQRQPRLARDGQHAGILRALDEQKYGTDGGPLHDPTVIAWLLDPGMFTGRQCNVEIETGSDLTLGATVIDWWKVTDRTENAFVGGVDADRFFELFIERVGRL